MLHSSTLDYQITTTKITNLSGIAYDSCLKSQTKNVSSSSRCSERLALALARKKG